MGELELWPGPDSTASLVSLAVPHAWRSDEQSQWKLQLVTVNAIQSGRETQRVLIRSSKKI